MPWYALLLLVAGFAAVANGETESAAAGGVATSAAAAAPPLSVRNVWSRATPPGAAIGVAYFEIINSGAADELLEIEAPIAQRVEMHATSTAGGMMQMSRKASLIVPAAARLVFEPGGLHAMLVNLSQPLREGESIVLILTFRHAGKVTVSSSVAEPGAMIAPDPAAQK